MASASMPSGASSSRQPEGQLDAAWLASLDAVYRLIEDEEAARQYSQLSKRIAEAVKLTEEAVEEIGLPRISLSFNGGKDCTVIAHILAAVLRRKARNTASLSSASPVPVPATRAVYITCDSPFIEVERFIAASLPRYNLRIRSVDGDMKMSLEQYLDGGGRQFESPLSNGHSASRRHAGENVEPDTDSGKGITAIFIGTRSTDPNGGSVGKRAWTDAGWPQVERIHPILDWTYQDVWSFLRCPLLAYEPASRWTREQREEEGCAHSPGIPYCLLYDLGYTSLGNTYNTFPNPHLSDDDTESEKHIAAIASGKPSKGDEGRTARFRPAYLLADGGLERKGRVRVAQHRPA